MNTLRLLLALSAFYFLSCQNKPAGPDPVLLNVQEYAAKIDSTPSAQIIDVRTLEEFSEGHLPNATNFDWTGDTFRADVLNFDKNKPVFVYCQGGGRSSAAAQYMAKAGFMQVYDLDGGFKKWQQVGKPVVLN